MYDTHCHILPGLDDGAADLTETLAFLHLAAGQGVTAVFATPHCCDGVFDCTNDAILDTWQRVCDAAERQGHSIRILPGAEIRVTHDLVDRYDAGRLLTLGNTGRFLLLELPPMFIVPGVFRIIRQLGDRGITPLIAHAERNPMILARPGLAADLISAGARLQVTAGSLTGDFGRPAYRTARAMAENHQVFCLGSDLHPGRKYRMQTAQKKLGAWIGPENTRKLLRENPAQILEASRVVSGEPVNRFI